MTIISVCHELVLCFNQFLLNFILLCVVATATAKAVAAATLVVLLDAPLSVQHTNYGLGNILSGL